MSDNHVRMTIEFNIDKELLKEKGLSVEDVLNNIVFQRSHDDTDGFEIFTNIPGFDITNDFFLTNGKVISKEIIPERSLGDGLDEYRELVKKDILTNGGVYNLSYLEMEELSNIDDIIEPMAEAVRDLVNDYGIYKYEALYRAFEVDFKKVLCDYKNKFLEEYKVPKTFAHLGEYKGQSGYNDENFILGMIAENGDAYYISLENDDLIRTNEDIALVLESEYKDLETEYGDLNLWSSYGEKYVAGGFAENQLFYIYDANGNIGLDDLSVLFSENPIYISEAMSIKLEEIKVLEGERLNSLDKKIGHQISAAKEKSEESSCTPKGKFLDSDTLVK